MQKLPFKLSNGGTVEFYTLTQGQQSLVCMNYGARLVSWKVPHPTAANGELELLLNHKDPTKYENDPSYMGAVVGPVPNRIADASISVAGAQYKLQANEGSKALHSSDSGFSNYLFDLAEQGDNYLLFTCDIEDMADKLPGNRHLEVRYELSLKPNGKYCLDIRYKMSSDKATVCNVTNHSYFKLWDSTILAANGMTYAEALAATEVKLPAKFFTPTDEDMLLTGEVLKTQDSLFDFTKRADLSKGLQILGNTPVKGYDHNFILERDFDHYSHAAGAYYSLPASFYSPCAKVALEVLTTEIGAQLYTANYLDEGISSDDEAFGRHGAFCFETQSLPNSFKNCHFADIFVDKDKPYVSTTSYEYSYHE